MSFVDHKYLKLIFVGRDQNIRKSNDIILMSKKLVSIMLHFKAILYTFCSKCIINDKKREKVLFLILKTK